MARSQAVAQRERAASKSARTSGQSGQDKPVKATKFKKPKSLALAADEYAAVREQRLAIEKQAKAVQEHEAFLKQWLIDNLPKSQAGGIAGKTHRVEIKTRDVPTIEDEKKFMRFAQKPGNEDLVKTSPVVSAIQARWEAGKKVPGVGEFTIVSLSLSKLK